MKMVPTLDPADLARQHHDQSLDESQQHMGRDVAHELNNILTIIQGYAQRMMVKHGENPALRPDLQIISDNTRRAVTIVRAAARARANQTVPMV